MFPERSWKEFFALVLAIYALLLPPLLIMIGLGIVLALLIRLA
jgi:hypothetical protein